MLAGLVALAAGCGGGDDEADSNGLKLFVAGKLANFDERPLAVPRAGVTIRATDSSSGSGVERFEVSVDGKQVAEHKVDCTSKCPASANFAYRYDAERYGSGSHEVTFEAIGKDGGIAKQELTVEPPPSKGTAGAPKPVPAFYLTASNPDDLSRQAQAAATRFSRARGKEDAVLVLDFGAARLRESDSTYGVSLRSGTFFTHDEAGDALQAALDELGKQDKGGSVTVVYSTSNANLSSPGKGFTTFGEDEAKAAGEQQASTLTGLKPPSGVSVAPGGDIEPGYDTDGAPDISTELVAGAVDGPGSEPYYDVGTAPCDADGKCVNGWTVDDICAVSSGDGKTVLPEVYASEQATEWAAVAKKCSIKSFAGSSGSSLGNVSPAEGWRALGERSSADVGRLIVVFPG